MNQSELFEAIVDKVKDTANITQLLLVELSANEDDIHIIRSIAIIEKMLQNILRMLQQFHSD